MIWIDFMGEDIIWHHIKSTHLQVKWGTTLQPHLLRSLRAPLTFWLGWAVPVVCTSPDKARLRLRRAARRKEHHCSQVTSLFFSIFRDMYGVFYLNVCLCFFVVNGFWYGFGSPGLFFGKKQNNYNRWHHSFVPVAQSQSKMHVFVSRVLFGYSKMTILASTKLCFSFFYHFCFEMIFSGNEYILLLFL